MKWDFSLEMLGDKVGYVLNFLFYAYPDNKVSSSYNSSRNRYNDNDCSSTPMQNLPSEYVNDIDFKMHDISNSYSGCINSVYGIMASIDEYISKNRITFNISVTFEIDDLDRLNRGERSIFSYAQNDAKQLARNVKEKALYEIQNINYKYGVNKKFDVVVNINVSKY